jgi:cysteate synthase
MKSSYFLKCLECKVELIDDYTLNCPKGCNSLLRAEYPNHNQLQLEKTKGMFRFKNWLPVNTSMKTSADPITYKAIELGKELGLENLYVTFNGYWPEKGAFMTSGSFKELEAYPTFLRLNHTNGGIIQVSSAGNTGRAFSHAAVNLDKKVIVVVPKTSLHRLWHIEENEQTCLISVDGDYWDAIHFGNELLNSKDNIYSEGGAKNVARRDGMGLTILDATLKIGKIPDYYFQAVGSGTGGIAAYEMVLRLINDGRFGNKPPKFYLSQNAPFTPMANAWKERRRQIVEDIDMPNAKESIKRVYSDLLTNRKPPYSIKGGVFDTLQETDGEMPIVSNNDAIKASNLFENFEGIDIDPAAAVALASLIDTIENDPSFNKSKNVMLNITGGGYTRIAEDFNKFNLKPQFSVKIDSDYAQAFKDVTDWYKN